MSDLISYSEQFEKIVAIIESAQERAYRKVSPLVTQLSWTKHLKIMSACKTMKEGLRENLKT